MKPTRCAAIAVVLWLAPIQAQRDSGNSASSPATFSNDSATQQAQPPPPPPPEWWHHAVAIEIDSSPPGARVLLNGYLMLDERGQALQTPCTVPHVLPGEYELELIGADDFYAKRDVSVDPKGELPRLTLARDRHHRWADRDPQSVPFIRIDSRLPIPHHLSLPDRLKRLVSLLEPAVRLSARRSDPATVNARLAVSRFNPDIAAIFAPIAGQWDASSGALVGRPVTSGVSQIVLPVPFATDRIKVTATGRSDAVFELCLFDPNAHRFQGTTAIGRLHFGRMEHTARTDWIELSTRYSGPEPVHGVRFPDRPQDMELLLRSKRLTAELSVASGTKRLKRALQPGDPPPTAYVGSGCGTNNTIEIDRLDVEGGIDLLAETTDVLVGMGDSFWGQGRDVTLCYTTGGCAHRILLNGQQIFESPAIPDWLPVATVLRRTDVSLHRGDILAFELTGADDDKYLSLVGFDRATQRVVLASHPLVWQSHLGLPDAGWYSTFEPDPNARPRITSADRTKAVAEFADVLKMPHPGLPITSLTPPDGTFALKYSVR